MKSLGELAGQWRREFTGCGREAMDILTIQIKIYS